MNGPRGRVDKRCQIEFTTPGRIVSTAMAPSWRGALEAALARAAQRIVRQMQRSQLRDRMSPRQQPITDMS